MSGFPGKGTRIDYYWRLPLDHTRRTWLLAAFIFCGSFLISAFHYGHDKSPAELLPHLFIALLCILFIKWHCAPGPETLAISIFDDKVVVRAVMMQYELPFRHVTHVCMRRPLSSFWDWRIELRIANRAEVFHVPAGELVDADPRQLLAQIKQRVKAERALVQAGTEEPLHA